MLCNVESQRGFLQSNESAANDVILAVPCSSTQSKFRKNGNKKNAGVICEVCKRPGHTKESCFKLNGVLDWYKEFVDKKKGKKVEKVAVAVVDAK